MERITLTLIVILCIANSGRSLDSTCARTLSGMTVVTMTGSNFVNSTTLLCRFGQESVTAFFVSPTVITCKTPPHEEGAVEVFVTTNGQDFTTVGPMFKFRSALTVTSVLPLSGPHHGGTRLSIFGSNFANSNSLSCKYGPSVVVMARWISTVQLECVSPAIDPGAVTVEVSNNGKDFTDDKVIFTAFGPPVVWNIEPSLGPRSGGTPVVVRGQHLTFGDNLLCRFDRITVQATILDTETIECAVPENQRGGVVEFSVSTNSIDYSREAVTYSYIDPPKVASVVPTSGSSFGGDTLHVRGEGFFLPTGLHANLWAQITCLDLRCQQLLYQRMKFLRNSRMATRWYYFD